MCRDVSKKSARSLALNTWPDPVSAPDLLESTAEVLSLLEEQENQLRCAALQRLNEASVRPPRNKLSSFAQFMAMCGQVVDQFWHEIADYLNDIETLYEDWQELLLPSVALSMLDPQPYTQDSTPKALNPGLFRTSFARA